MPDPTRQQIRDAAKAAIIAGGYFSTNVEIGRHDGIPVANLPHCDVYTGQSQYELDSKTAAGQRRYSVTMELICEMVVKPTTGALAEENIDAARSAIMTAIMADTTLGGTCFDLNPAEDGPEVDDEGSENYGSNSLVFDVEFDELR